MIFSLYIKTYFYSQYLRLRKSNMWGGVGIIFAFTSRDSYTMGVPSDFLQVVLKF